MTVLVEVPKVSHITDAVQVAFAFTFKVLTEAAVQVYLNDSNTAEDPGTYSVALAGDPLGQVGGTVTMNVAPAAGTLTIIRVTAQSQNTDYNPFDPFPANTHETGLDKAMMVAQENSEIASRAGTLPPGSDPSVDYTLPAYDAGKGWMWSESGDKKVILSNDNFNDIVSDASASAAAASASASSASGSAAAAASSETNAASSETNAAASQSKAQEWAEKPEDDPVEPGQFSALHWASKAVQAAPVPPGAITMWPVATPPVGWLICDGSSQLTASFAGLFAILGYSYGGAGANFNLPDMRGEFVRGTDNGAGNDPDAAGRTDRGDGTTGDVVGTKQGFATQTHQHSGPSHSHSGPNHSHAAGSLTYSVAATGSGASIRAAGSGSTQSGTPAVAGSTAAAGTGQTGASGTGNTGNNTGNQGTETRPVNIGMNYIIKT